MLFSYKDIVWEHFLPFPLYGGNSVSAHVKKAVSLEQLVCFYLMDAVNSVAEFPSSQNKKGKSPLSC